MQLLWSRHAAFSAAATRARRGAFESGQSRWDVRRLKDAAARCSARHRKKSGRDMRRGTAAAATDTLSPLAAWMADAARSTVAGAAAARMRARDHGIALLKQRMAVDQGT